jgi:hypothetical protein
MSDGGSTVTEVGFFLSRILGINPADPNLVRLGANRSDANFILVVKPPESLGVQIYARNSADETYGAVKRVSLSGNSEPAQSWLSGSKETTTRWRLSSWFGTFLPFRQRLALT